MLIATAACLSWIIIPKENDTSSPVKDLDIAAAVLGGDSA